MTASMLSKAGASTRRLLPTCKDTFSAAALHAATCAQLVIEESATIACRERRMAEAHSAHSPGSSHASALNSSAIQLWAVCVGQADKESSRPCVCILDAFEVNHMRNAQDPANDDRASVAEAVSEKLPEELVLQRLRIGSPLAVA